MVTKKNKSTHEELSTVGNMAESSSTAAIRACEPSTRRPMPDFDVEQQVGNLSANADAGEKVVSVFRSVGEFEFGEIALRVDEHIPRKQCADAVQNEQHVYQIETIFRIATTALKRRVGHHDRILCFRLVNHFR
ncbi:hypothetical protein T11_18073 [Trichinella zimbabwensis]|uniref:Uncharacterized protein n=1 Tax=Trichinella zimbabwensis TaxID=268475 RepID=A0A0V1HBY6_9BILA|nr:hypothetical protein T11_18073 [Trichinella zimbabwensis]